MFGDAELAAWGEVAAALNATGVPVYLSVCPKSDLPAVSGVLSPYSGERGLYFPPQDWSRDAKRAVANAWLVEVRNNVDGWSQRTASCKDVGAPCGMQTNIDSQVELGKWNETGPGGLVDADILEICQLNGTVNRYVLAGSSWRWYGRRTHASHARTPPPPPTGQASRRQSLACTTSSGSCCRRR